MTLYSKPGLCECGCGEPTPIARRNHTAYGWVKGQPMRYLRGHGHRIKASVVALLWADMEAGIGDIVLMRHYKVSRYFLRELRISRGARRGMGRPKSKAA